MSNITIKQEPYSVGGTLDDNYENEQIIFNQNHHLSDDYRQINNDIHSPQPLLPTSMNACFEQHPIYKFENSDRGIYIQRPYVERFQSNQRLISNDYYSYYQPEMQQNFNQINDTNFCKMPNCNSCRQISSLHTAFNYGNSNQFILQPHSLSLLPSNYVDELPFQELISYCYDKKALTTQSDTERSEQFKKSKQTESKTNNDDPIFSEVSGRLSLLCSSTKYKLRVSELKRRFNKPECINLSLLGGLMRRAKSKNGGRLLIDRLKRYGIDLQLRKRMKEKITLFSSLIEKEAETLANDFGTSSKSYFPVKQLANYSTRRHCITEYDIESARSITSTLIQLVKCIRKKNSSVAREINDGNLKRFDLLTHGFGSIAVIGVLNIFQDYLNMLEAEINENGHIYE